MAIGDYNREARLKEWREGLSPLRRAIDDIPVLGHILSPTNTEFRSADAAEESYRKRKKREWTDLYTELDNRGKAETLQFTEGEEGGEPVPFRESQIIDASGQFYITPEGDHAGFKEFLKTNPDGSFYHGDLIKDLLNVDDTKRVYTDSRTGETKTLDLATLVWKPEVDANNNPVLTDAGVPKGSYIAVGVNAEGELAPKTYDFNNADNSEVIELSQADVYSMLQTHLAMLDQVVHPNRDAGYHAHDITRGRGDSYAVASSAGNNQEGASALLKANASGVGEDPAASADLQSLLIESGAFSFANPVEEEQINNTPTDAQYPGGGGVLRFIAQNSINEVRMAYGEEAMEGMSDADIMQFIQDNPNWLAADFGLENISDSGEYVNADNMTAEEQESWGEWWDGLSTTDKALLISNGLVLIPGVGWGAKAALTGVIKIGGVAKNLYNYGVNNINRLWTTQKTTKTVTAPGGTRAFGVGTETGKKIIAANKRDRAWFVQNKKWKEGDSRFTKWARNRNRPDKVTYGTRTEGGRTFSPTRVGQTATTVAVPTTAYNISRGTGFSDPNDLQGMADKLSIPSGDENVFHTIGDEIQIPAALQNNPDALQKWVARNESDIKEVLANSGKEELATQLFNERDINTLEDVSNKIPMNMVQGYPNYDEMAAMLAGRSQNADFDQTYMMYRTNFAQEYASRMEAEKNWQEARLKERERLHKKSKDNTYIEDIVEIFEVTDAQGNISWKSFSAPTVQTQLGLVADEWQTSPDAPYYTIDANGQVQQNLSQYPDAWQASEEIRAATGLVAMQFMREFQPGWPETWLRWAQGKGYEIDKLLTTDNILNYTKIQYRVVNGRAEITRMVLLDPRTNEETAIDAGQGAYVNAFGQPGSFWHSSIIYNIPEKNKERIP